MAAPLASHNPFLQHQSRPDSIESTATSEGAWSYDSDAHGGVLPPRYTELFTTRAQPSSSSSADHESSIEKPPFSPLANMAAHGQPAHYDIGAPVERQDLKLISLDDAQRRFGAGAMRLVGQSSSTSPFAGARSEVGSVHLAMPDGMLQPQSTGGSGFLSLDDVDGKTKKTGFLGLDDVKGKGKGKGKGKDKKPAIGMPQPYLYEEHAEASRQKVHLPHIPAPIKVGYPLSRDSYTTTTSGRRSPVSSPSIQRNASNASDVSREGFDRYFDTPANQSTVNLHQDHGFLAAPQALKNPRAASSIYSETDHNPFLARGTRYMPQLGQTTEMPPIPQVMPQPTGSSFMTEDMFALDRHTIPRERSNSFHSNASTPTDVKRPVQFSAAVTGSSDDDLFFRPVAGMESLDAAGRLQIQQAMAGSAPKRTGTTHSTLDYGKQAITRQKTNARRSSRSDWGKETVSDVYENEVVLEGGFITQAQAEKPTIFDMNEKREQKVQKTERKKRWRNRCLMICGLRWKWWCIGVGLVLLAGLVSGGVLLGLKLKRDAPVKKVTVEEVLLRPDNLPVLPKMATIMKINGAPIVENRCTIPNTLWTCQLPPELRGTMMAEGPHVGALALSFKLKNVTAMITDSSYAVTFTPSPAEVPSDADYASLAGIDGVANNSTGEATPLVASLTFPTPNKTPSLSAKISRRQSTASKRPPASLFPTIINNQPLRLFDRGLDTEHYGFHAYFKKSIYLPDINGKSGNGDVEIPEGGLDAQNAKFVCVFSRSRFQIKIFTKQTTNILRAGQLTPAQQALSEFSTPTPASSTAKTEDGGLEKFKEMPYPVTVIEDRVGEGDAGRTVQCFELDEGGNAVLKDARPVVEWKVPESKRGCACEWRNWAE